MTGKEIRMLAAFVPLIPPGNHCPKLIDKKISSGLFGLFHKTERVVSWGLEMQFEWYNRCIRPDNPFNQGPGIYDNYVFHALKQARSAQEFSIGDKVRIVHHDGYPAHAGTVIACSDEFVGENYFGRPDYFLYTLRMECGSKISIPQSMLKLISKA